MLAMKSCCLQTLGFVVFFHLMRAEPWQVPEMAPTVAWFYI